jgi:hypothetical protein
MNKQMIKIFFGNNDYVNHELFDTFSKNAPIEYDKVVVAEGFVSIIVPDGKQYYINKNVVSHFEVTEE